MEEDKLTDVLPPQRLPARFSCHLPCLWSRVRIPLRPFCHFFHFPSFLNIFKDLFLNIIKWKRVNKKTSTWLNGKAFHFQAKGHEFKPPHDQNQIFTTCFL